MVSKRIDGLRDCGKNVRGLTAEEPEGSGRVVDRDLPHGELGRVGRDKLVARVNTSHDTVGIGDVGAGSVEGGLGDSVVLLQELELNDIAVGNTSEPA